MPDGQRDAEPVTYGRWQEAHAALEGRLADAEARLAARINEVAGDLAAYTAQAAAAAARRRDRQWALLITILAGLALPLLVVAITALAAAQLRP